MSRLLISDPRMAKAHMEVAHIYANLSRCKRSKVGCVIVQGGVTVSMGYNGMPRGSVDKSCECQDGVTKEVVIHAEQNALIAAARSTISVEGGALLVTLSPCITCAKLIIASGISEVFYAEIYRDNSSLAMLEEYGIETYYLPLRS